MRFVTWQDYWLVLSWQGSSVMSVGPLEVMESPWTLREPATVTGVASLSCLDKAGDRVFVEVAIRTDNPTAFHDLPSTGFASTAVPETLEQLAPDQEVVVPWGGGSLRASPTMKGVGFKEPLNLQIGDTLTIYMDHTGDIVGVGLTDGPREEDSALR